MPQEPFEKSLTPYTDASIITQALADVYVAAKSDDGRTAEGKQLFPENETPMNKLIDGVSHVIISMMGSPTAYTNNIVDAELRHG